MPELLFDPWTWGVVAVIVSVAIVAGYLRHESWWEIAGAALGANAFLIGLRWSGSLSDEAFWAAALATAGFGVWSEVAGRSRRRSTVARADAPS